MLIPRRGEEDLGELASTQPLREKDAYETDDEQSVCTVPDEDLAASLRQYSLCEANPATGLNPLATLNRGVQLVAVAGKHFDECGEVPAPGGVVEQCRYELIYCDQEFPLCGPGMGSG